MLLKLRGGLNSFLVTILLSVLILAFAIWGIGPGILQSAQDTVADVDGVEISTQNFANVVQRRAQQFQLQLPGFGDVNEIVQATNLDYQVLNELLAAARIAAHTNNLGLRASDKQIAKQLLSIEAFKLAGGFSPEAMRQTLISNNLSEEQFYTEIRRDVARQQIIDALAEGSVVSDDLVEAIYTFERERRTAELMSIRTADITDSFEPTEDELAAFYEASKENYRTPERRSYRYVLVTPALYSAAQNPSEDDIQRAYDDNAEKYIVPELRSVLQVTLPSVDAAEAFIADVRGGADFVASAVAQTSFNADEVDLGDLSRDDVERDFGAEAADIVFALDEGALSAPVPALAGVNVFMVTSVSEGSQIALSEVREEVTALARQELALDAMFDALPDINDAVLDQGSLDAVAQQLNLSLASVTGVSQSGDNPDGNRIVTTPEEAAILRQAFLMQLGDPPELLDLDPSDNRKGAFVVELMAIDEPIVPALDDIRTRVLADWQQEQREQAAGTLADEALARVEAGETFTDVAESINAVTFDIKNAARTGGDDSQLTPTIRRLLFDLNIGEAGVERSADGYAVLRLKSVEPGDPSRAPAELADMKTQLESSISNDVVLQYQTWLTETYPGTINQAIVNQLFRGNALIR